MVHYHSSVIYSAPLLRSRRSSVTPSKLALRPQQCHLHHSCRSSILCPKLFWIFKSKLKASLVHCRSSVFYSAPAGALLLRPNLSTAAAVSLPPFPQELRYSVQTCPLPQQCHPLRSRRSSVTPSKLVHCRSSIIYPAPAGPPLLRPK